MNLIKKHMMSKVYTSRDQIYFEPYISTDLKIKFRLLVFLLILFII